MISTEKITIKALPPFRFDLSAEARQIAKSWGKWKGLAAYYLVVAEMLGVEV